jgi:hypothetical protein
MSGDYIDRLVSDIQEYLKEEEQRNLSMDMEEEISIEEPARAPGRLRRNALVGAITLLAACVVGSVTVAIMLLGILGAPEGGEVDTIWLFAAGGCGAFFSAMLISSWKRLILLGKIERNTRRILESKQAANDLLEDYIRKFT